jgi:gas vesicle protein
MPGAAGNARGTGVAGLMEGESSTLSVPTGGMYYDESSKRRNLLTGLVFGTLLGAGLALLFAPGDGVAGKARFVARSARRLGRAGRRTRGYARALHASIGAAVDDAARRDDEAADDVDGIEAEDVGRDGDDGDELVDRSPRVSRMARRRFTL